ncbi:MAG: hypothetical protein ACC645_13320 [Pirellulales bacterium]
MSRAPRHEEEMPGQDSFLDVVANIVGILIILVMTVGVRAGHVRAARDETDRADAEAASTVDPLVEAQRLAVSLEHDLQQLGRRAGALKQELSARQREREEWETLLLAGRRAIEAHRETLDADARARFDTRRALAEADAKLDQLTREQIALESAKTETKTIRHRPTPISRTVHGKELHFQLRNGRVASIPLDTLLDEFKATAQRQVWKLNRQSELIDTVGPIGDFRLRYRLERLELSAAVQMETGRSGTVIRLSRWELLPVSSDVGEPLEIALSEGSRFATLLANHPQSRTTVTLWVYPESFAPLRALKDRLYRRGYSVAIRPLPDGVPIGGSPMGTKSAAQ